MQEHKLFDAEYRMMDLIWETDPIITSRIAEWQDLKFGFMMHWGIYAQWEVVESWSICNEPWINRNGADYYQYKQDYQDLNKSFNPRNFDAARWADAARMAGMKYVVFVEGVGPNFTPFGWHDGYDNCPGGNSNNWWGFYPILLCAHKDEELVYMADERAGCWQFPPAKIDDKERILFRLYPNPVKNSLTLQFEDGIALNGMLYITNMYGCVVHSQQVNDARMRVNVRSLSAGSYIATYFVNGKKSSVKFVKQ